MVKENCPAEFEVKQDQEHVTIGKAFEETGYDYALFSDKGCTELWEIKGENVFYAFNFLSEALEFAKAENLIVDNPKQELTEFLQEDKEHFGGTLKALVEKFERHPVGKKQFDSILPIYRESIMADAEENWGWSADFRLDPEKFVDGIIKVASKMIEASYNKQFAKEIN